MTSKSKHRATRHEQAGKSVSEPAQSPAPLWAGGFEEAMHPALARISESMEQDMPLCDADLRASAAYARALARAGVLTHAEGERLAVTLEAMRAEFAAGGWTPTVGEDVHTAIEAEVTARVGELGGRLHTGRSRNDQVSTALRLAVADRIDGLLHALTALQEALAQRASAELDTLLPAYTHWQRAQPVRLAHWLLGFAWPLQRDAQRLRQVRERVLMLPLGSGAVSGHPFGLDRVWLAQQLGFCGVTQNSLDAVGDRDFAVETAFACALCATHLSRLAEELVIWSSAEFSFVQWPDALATGSSLMPNKKNPDLAELVRGRSASVIGDLTTLLVLLKGLPSSYQRDLQEDKPPVWRATANVHASLVAMTEAIKAIRFNRERMREALSDDLLATEVADLLVGKGVAFRAAHGIVAKVAAEARRRGVGMRALVAAGDFVLPEPLTAADFASLDATRAIERRTAVGGTARAAVEQQLAALHAALGAARA